MTYLVRHIGTQGGNKPHINQDFLEPYRENIGPGFFLYGPQCAQSKLSRLIDQSINQSLFATGVFLFTRVYIVYSGSVC